MRLKTRDSLGIIGEKYCYYEKRTLNVGLY